MGNAVHTRSSSGLVVGLLALVAVAIGFAGANTGSDDWTKRMSVSYRMGEADSQMTALHLARDKMRQKAISQSGAYIQETQVLEDDRFSESVQLLKAAHVMLADEAFRIEVEPETQAQTLHYEAQVTVDTQALADRVAALQGSTTFQSDLQRLAMESNSIRQSLGRIGRNSLSDNRGGGVLAQIKTMLAEQLDARLSAVRSLDPDRKMSLLAKSQQTAEVLELAKLKALDLYLQDVIDPLLTGLEVTAEVISVSPSIRNSDMTEVKVELAATYSMDNVPTIRGSIGTDLNDIERALRDIRYGDFSVQTSRSSWEDIGDLRLSGYWDWAKNVFLKMRLVAVAKAGKHEQHIDVIADAELAPEFTVRGVPYERSVTYSRPVTLEIPNEEAAVLEDVDAGLKLLSPNQPTI